MATMTRTEHLSIDEMVDTAESRVFCPAGRPVEHSRRVAIDFGTYPTEFTDLQYLALDHLLGQLVAGQAGVG